MSDIKSSPKISLSIFAILILLILATRFYDLGALPVFNDQATYIRWSQIFLDYPSLHNFFISTIDGKQPLSIWLTAMAIPLFPDSLIAERLLSALFGAGTLLAGAIFLARNFSKNSAAIFLFLSLTSPYLLWYSRYLLVETVLVFTVVVSFALFWELYTARRRLNGIGLMLGALLVAGYLNKAPIVLAVAASFAFPIIFRNAENFRKRFLIHLSAIAVMGVVPITLGWLRGFLHLPHVKGASQLATHIDFSSFDLASRAGVMFSNIAGASDFFGWYIGVPMFFLAILSFAVLAGKRDPLGWIALAYVAVPLICIVAIIPERRVLYIRYFLVCVPFLYFPVSHYLGKQIENGKSVFAVIAVIFLATAQPALLSMKMLGNPATAPLHPAHRLTFVEGWTSGYGVAEAGRFILEEAEGAKTLLLTNFRWGNPADGINLSLWRSGVTVTDVYWEANMPIVPESRFRFAMYESKYTRPGPWKPVEIVSIADYEKIFFVCSTGTCFPDTDTFRKRNTNLILKRSFPKPGGIESVDIYEWNGEDIFKTGTRVLWFKDPLK